jgi:hypothetical protein
MSLPVNHLAGVVGWLAHTETEDNADLMLLLYCGSGFTLETLYGWWELFAGKTLLVFEPGGVQQVQNEALKALAEGNVTTVIALLETIVTSGTHEEIENAVLNTIDDAMAQWVLAPALDLAVNWEQHHKTIGPGLRFPYVPDPGTLDYAEIFETPCEYHLIWSDVQQTDGFWGSNAVWLKAYYRQDQTHDMDGVEHVGHAASPYNSAGGNTGAAGDGVVTDGGAGKKWTFLTRSFEWVGGQPYHQAALIRPVLGTGNYMAGWDLTYAPYWTPQDLLGCEIAFYRDCGGYVVSYKGSGTEQESFDVPALPPACESWNYVVDGSHRETGVVSFWSSGALIRTGLAQEKYALVPNTTYTHFYAGPGSGDVMDEPPAIVGGVGVIPTLAAAVMTMASAFNQYIVPAAGRTPRKPA